MDKRVELVLVPAAVMGHIVPNVELAKLILKRNDRISISIYIINVPIHSAKINAYVDSQSRSNPYPNRLTFVTLPTLSNLPDPSAPDVEFITELHKPLFKKAIEDRIKAGLEKPVGFVLDITSTGMVEIANELHVPSYIFYVAGANSLNLLFYAQTLADEQGVDVATEFSDPGFSSLVPGFKNPLTSKVIPSVLQDKEIMCEKLVNLARKLREMKGILVNTYVELESFGVQALSNDVEVKKLPPFYFVGPVLELGNMYRGGSDNEEKDSIFKWLDDQPVSSVVFLCFGSMGYFDEEQIKEIANGLDKSGHRFLWALRKPPSTAPSATNEVYLEALPEGFVERTTNKGKFIGWAPQIEVLAHPAIGGFVSHCGWNSVLESLWFEVPIATWPLYAEHQLHAFQLVKELEIAEEIRIDYKWKANKGNFLVMAEEIEKGVSKLMCMDENMRKKVKKMSKKGKKALQGGSSHIWLGHFIEDVCL